MSERSRSPSPPSEVSDDEEPISYFDFCIEIGKQKNRESLERHRDILKQMRLRSEERVASMLKELDAFYKKSLEAVRPPTLKVRPACRLAPPWWRCRSRRRLLAHKATASWSSRRSRRRRSLSQSSDTLVFQKSF